jgi:hypothetical protein
MPDLPLTGSYTSTPGLAMAAYRVCHRLGRLVVGAVALFAGLTGVAGLLRTLLRERGLLHRAAREGAAS